jgi:hypothetical protein
MSTHLQDLQCFAVQAISHLLLYLVATVADPDVLPPETVRLQQRHNIRYGLCPISCGSSSSSSNGSGSSSSSSKLSSADGS